MELTIDDNFKVAERYHHEVMMRVEDGLYDLANGPDVWTLLRVTNSCKGNGSRGEHYGSHRADGDDRARSVSAGVNGADSAHGGAGFEGPDSNYTNGLACDTGTFGDREGR